MNRIARFKKVEAFTLGIAVPVVLISYTVMLLLTNEAVFWGRSSTVIYHGFCAYLVSLLWFGAAGLLVGHFYLRTYRLLRQASHKMFMWLSAIFVLVGLVSGIMLA